MRGPYGARCQGRSIAASLPKAPHYVPPSLSHPRTSSCLCLSRQSHQLANLVVKVSGQVEPTAFSNLEHLGIYVSTPPTEGRSARLRRPRQNLPTTSLFHFTFLHHLKHRIHIKSPRMPPAIMPKSELCRMAPHISFCSLLAAIYCQPCVTCL
jgi:hypothetical protein